MPHSRRIRSVATEALRRRAGARRGVVRALTRARVVGVAGTSRSEGAQVRAEERRLAADHGAQRRARETVASGSAELADAVGIADVARFATHRIERVDAAPSIDSFIVVAAQVRSDLIESRLTSDLRIFLLALGIEFRVFVGAKFDRFVVFHQSKSVESQVGRFYFCITVIVAWSGRDVVKLRVSLRIFSLDNARL